VYGRRKHYWTIEDATRILDGLIPPEGLDGNEWASEVVQLLRQSTLDMLARILPFLDEEQISDLYTWVIGLLDNMLGLGSGIASSQDRSIDLIYYLASRTGLTVDIKRSY
jgi:hypothetical protein